MRELMLQQDSLRTGMSVGRVKEDDMFTNKASADFISMLIDSLSDLEAAVRKLSIDKKGPDLFLRPESNYLTFSDGYTLHWTLFGVIEMRTNKQAGYKRVPIDDEHLDALVAEKGIMICTPTHPLKSCFVGHPCQHLKLRVFIEEVHANIIDERRKDCNLTYRESLKRLKGEYPLVIQDSDTFRGLIKYQSAADEWSFRI